MFKILGIKISLHDIVVCLLLTVILFEGIFVYIMWENKNGILTGAGKKKWRAETLQKILKNEKYIGDALLQKTYTVDFLEKKRVPNNGLVPQYYVENSHEAIIPRDLYMQVQEEMVRRANLCSGQNRKKRVYSSKYALSSIVYGKYIFIQRSEWKVSFYELYCWKRDN